MQPDQNPTPNSGARQRPASSGLDSATTSAQPAAPSSPLPDSGDAKLVRWDAGAEVLTRTSIYGGVLFSDVYLRKGDRVSIEPHIASPSPDSGEREALKVPCPACAGDGMRAEFQGNVPCDACGATGDVLGVRAVHELLFAPTTLRAIADELAGIPPALSGQLEPLDSQVARARRIAERIALAITDDTAAAPSSPPAGGEAPRCVGCGETLYRESFEVPETESLAGAPSGWWWQCGGCGAHGNVQDAEPGPAGGEGDDAPTCRCGATMYREEYEPAPGALVQHTGEFYWTCPDCGEDRDDPPAPASPGGEGQRPVGSNEGGRRLETVIGSVRVVPECKLQAVCTTGERCCEAGRCLRAAGEGQDTPAREEWRVKPHRGNPRTVANEQQAHGLYRYLGGEAVVQRRTVTEWVDVPASREGRSDG